MLCPKVGHEKVEVEGRILKARVRKATKGGHEGRSETQCGNSVLEVDTKSKEVGCV